MGTFAEYTNKKKKKSYEGTSFREYTNDVLGSSSDDDIAPVKTTASRGGGGRRRDDDIAPIASKEEEKKKKWYDGWFKKSESDSVAGAIIGTLTDATEDALTGLIGIGEKTVDAFAQIAPYHYMGQYYQNGGAFEDPSIQKLHQDTFETMKKDSAEFIKKDLYNEQEVARKILTNLGAASVLPNNGYANLSEEQRKALQEGTRYYLDNMMEQDSVFDEKTDAVVQSAGQLGGTIGLQAIGVPWWFTTGVTSYGAEAENALNQGATLEEAGASGAINAAAEILTEKISGGIKFGGKTLDDALTKNLASSISNKFVRNFAKVGMDTAGEGFEEVLSSAISKFGEALYKEESIGELLTSEEAMDEYIESFIGGAMLGNVSSAGKAIVSETKGVDYTSGLSKNEKAVVDKVYKDSVAEQEQDGKKLSSKEKSAIYKATLRNMEKGYIDTDTIESVLGGETYKSYKSVTEQEEALQREFDELNKMKQGEMTGEQIDRRTELKKQLADLETTSKKSQIRQQLDSEMLGLVQGSKLSESYNEKSRRGQAFEADLTQYDAKQREVVQRAVESGILNNTNRTHDFVDMVAKISSDKGVLFDFTNNQRLKESGFAVEGKTVNGYVTSEGNITLNIDSAKSLNSVVGHEIAHVLEGTELYTELADAVRQYAETKGEYAARFEELTIVYNGVDADIDAEVVADLVGDYLFTDADFVRKLSVEQPNIFQRIFDEIKYMCKVATAGSKEARELEKVKRSFEKAYQESGSEAVEVSDTNVKYSIREEAPPKETGIAYKVFFVKDGKLYPPMVANPDGADTPMGVWLNADIGTAAPPSKTGRQQVKAGGKGTQGGGGSLAFRPGWHLGDLPRASQFDRVNPETGKKELFPENFVWAEVEYAKDVDYQEEAMSYGYTENGKFRHAYAGLPKLPENGYYRYRTNPNPDTVPWVITGAMKVNRLLSDAEVNSILEENGVEPVHRQGGDVGLDKFGFNEDGSVKYSLSDSDGKQLTKEQQEYFKDSKVRDENGNLKVMYHGTERSGFTVFDRGFSDDGRSFFFTDSPMVAKGYSGTYDEIIPGRKLTVEEMTDIIYDSYRWVEFEDGEYKIIHNNRGEFETEYSSKDYDEFVAYVQEEYGANEPAGNYKVYLDIKNPLVVDADGNGWDELPSIDDRETMTTREYAEYAEENGYDGVIFKDIYDIAVYASGKEKFEPSTVAIAFNSNQIKSVANTAPTSDADIRYSLTEDSQGRELSAEQQEYFKDSKVRDENGGLKVMYHGTPNGDFTVFRDGTYFTESKEYADVYQTPSASSISTGKVASNQKTFEVYLNITKPFDINDSEARSIYINDYIKGGNATGINPYLSDEEYAKINSIDWTEGEDLRDFLIENGYDYDGLILDEGGVGGYGEEVVSRGLSYVIFNPEQVKNITNIAPTSDTDIRFSLSETVEETKDLIAVHNLTGGKLLKSLKLGGLPMPSVAILRAESGHSEFGEISLVLDKSAIDPQANRSNKLYSGDAWTPTYPRVEYKANETVRREIDDKLRDLVPYDIQDALGRIMLDSDNMRETLNRYDGDMVDAFKANDSMKYAYLRDTGVDIALPTKEADLYLYGKVSNAAVRYFSGKLVDGLQTIEKYRNMPSKDLIGDYELRVAIADALNFDVLRQLEEGTGDYEKLKANPIFSAEKVTFSQIDNMLIAARKLLTNGIQQSVDGKAARELIRDTVDQTAYESWLEEQFYGIVEKEGIRNNRDFFTPSGNRRSFEALHYEHNLENVIRAMMEKGEKGIGGFGGGNIFGASTTEFLTIDDMRQSKNRLQQMSDEEYQSIKDEFARRFFEIASSLPNDKGSFSANDDAANTLIEAVSKYKTRSGIANYIRKELQGWGTYSEQAVDDLIELVEEIRNMPTGYFEAKPQRAVGFDEVGVFIIPSDADVKLKQELLNRGYNIAEYDPQVEGDRSRVVNQFEQYMFSLSDVGHTNPTGNYNVYGRDIALEQPDIAPVREDVEPFTEDYVPLYDAKPGKGVVEGQQSMFAPIEEAETPETITRSKLHESIIDNIKSTFSGKGFDFDDVLRKAKNISTFATVDNTPQRVMEKALGYKQGQVLSDLTVNRVAQNETEGIRWLNSFTDRKNGVLAKLSKKYHIKPGSKESAAAQMYAEGFYVNDKNEIINYGDTELKKDFPNPEVQKNIRGLASDPIIRQIYDETLVRINESRTRNAYPEIPKLDNYFLHFRAMDDTFSRLGLPFNPNDIRAKDLPTDLNGVTADLKPGQPYFASQMHRTGKRTSFDLLGGLERYLTSAKNQIYHIDDIQTLRALRNYIADTYGQAHGLEALDELSEEEAQERIAAVYGSHLSTFAKFLNEEANILAGKTALIDRGLEGVIGRRGITFLNTVNRQVGSNMVGFNLSSSLTNFLPVAQTFAKTNKADFVKAFAQTVSSKVGSVFGRNNDFAEQSPVMIRRKGADAFYRTPWQKFGDTGYVLMSAVDDISTELIARTKFNELTRKGMDTQKAHYETDKWVSRLMGDRSLGQQPQLYNSKMLGLVTKFQLEVRNQLDSQFYDTIQEAKVSNEDIENGLARNAKTAAKVASTFVQLAVVQHLFGQAFESVAGYNPAFDIIEVLLKTVGYDDDEESEDTVLDNIEQGFLELLGDLPYTSTLTGGRIPISSALPIEQLVTGQDDYGNEKSRLETLAEIAPYYVLPTGYGQIKKTHKGLSMFDEDLSVSGSYTDSGNLRFPVEDTLQNRVQAGLFGQYASDVARDYFDNERNPLKEKQIQEYADLGLPIRDYWEYREGLAKQEKLEDKFEYIADLPVSVEQKNIMINNIVDRKEAVDMSNYDDFANYEEFDFYTKNTEKYNFLQDNGVSYSEYKSSEEAKEEYDNIYSWWKQNPEKVTVSKAITDNVVEYRRYTGELNNIKADKDGNGESISGSAKEKKAAYISGLDLDYGQKIILFRTYYDGKEDKAKYNADIVEYLNNREDISYDEMVTILEQLDMKVYPDGTVEW